MDNTNQVVNDQPTTGTEEVGVVNLEENTTTATPPGSKTDPNLLLKSLQEEREKRRIAEEKLSLIESSASLTDVVSDEGVALAKQIQALEAKVSEVTAENAKKDVLINHPELKEKWAELEEFRNQPDNKGMNLKTAAKAFLIENGLMEPKRVGLEKSTGGTRTPAPTAMTAEDVKTLRETNFKKYQEMVINGQIKI